jgi:hypothetical protein
VWYGLIAAVALAAAAPPPPLRCLARFYAVVPEPTADGWAARLSDGTRVPYDDGRAKTADQRLAAPDVEDMFAAPYRPGPIRPVVDPAEDPGRVRVEAIFAATYGATATAVRRALVPIDFLGVRLRVHRAAAGAFARVAGRLASARAADPSLAPFLARFSGTFVWRTIAGTDRRSAHAYGVSIDLDARLSQYWRWQRPPAPLRWQNRIPQAIVAAFEAEGFIWGGRWYHYDTMHFEYRPEMLDPACRPG